MWILLKWCLGLLFFALPLITRAAGDGEVQQLRQQLEELKRRYEAQSTALRTLEARLQQVERPTARAPTRTAGRQRMDPVQAQQQSPQAGTQRVARAAADPGAAVGQGTVVAQGAGETADTAGERGTQVRKRPPTSRGVEAVLQEEHALFDRRLILEAGFTYARTDRAQINLSGFLALDAIFLGSISVDEVEADILTLDLTGRYGITDRLQADVNLPFLYRDSTFRSGGVGGAATQLAEGEVTLDPRLGDVSAGIYYHLLRETARWPDTVWNVRFKAPTGSDPFGIKVVEAPGTEGQGILRIPEELPSGNGVWTLSTGFSFVKTIDPAVVFANLSYFHNFEDGFDDISTDPDQFVPGEVDLGDSYQFGVGMAVALNERMSLSFSYAQRLAEKASTQPQGEPSAEIIGSDTNAATLNVGLTLALSEQLSMITNVGIGLTDDAPEVQFGMKFPYAF